MSRPQYLTTLQARIIQVVAFLGVALLLVCTALSSSFSTYSDDTPKSTNVFLSPLGEKTAMSNVNALAQASKDDGRLSAFLKNNKADFVKALDAGSSLEGWVIVMGAFELYVLLVLCDLHYRLLTCSYFCLSK